MSVSNGMLEIDVARSPKSSAEEVYSGSARHKSRCCRGTRTSFSSCRTMCLPRAALWFALVLTLASALSLFGGYVVGNVVMAIIQLPLVLFLVVARISLSFFFVTAMLSTLFAPGHLFVAPYRNLSCRPHWGFGPTRPFYAWTSPCIF